jgi:hypothetical protein
MQTLAVATSPGAGQSRGIIVDGWVKVAERNFNAGDLERTVYLFRRQGPGTSITATIRTADSLPYQEIRWSWAEWQDVSAILQPTSAAGNSSAPSVTLAAFQNGLNATLEVIGSASGLDPTVGTGFTQLAEQVGGVQGDFLTWGWQNANDTSVDASSSTGSDFWGILGAELATGTFTDGGASGTGPRLFPNGPIGAGPSYIFPRGTDSGGGGITAVAADTVTVSDSAVAIVTKVASATDAVTVSDSAVSSVLAVASATDSVTVSDSAVSGVISTASAADSVTVGDSAAATVSVAASASDSVAVSDSADAIVTITASAQDSLTVSDSAAAVVTIVSVATDSVTVSDSADAVVTVVAVAADTVTVSDSAAASVSGGGLVAEAADSVTVSDSANAIVTVVASASDSVTVSDSAEAGTVSSAAATDSVTVSDSATASTAFSAAASDSVTVNDSAVAITTLTASASDSLTPSDSAEAFVTIVASASDSVTVSDSAIGSIQGNITATATDSVTVSDSAIATLILGNPPPSGLSNRSGAYVAQRMRGRIEVSPHLRMLQIDDEELLMMVVLAAVQSGLLEMNDGNDALLGAGEEHQ